METLELRFLGEMEVLRAGKRLALPPSKKTRGLLAYLALSGRPHRRERLCSLLWDVADDPRGALRWSLSRLRAIVDEPDLPRILAPRDSVAFAAQGACDRRPRPEGALRRRARRRAARGASRARERVPRGAPRGARPRRLPRLPGLVRGRARGGAQAPRDAPARPRLSPGRRSRGGAAPRADAGRRRPARRDGARAARAGPRGHRPPARGRAAVRGGLSPAEGARPARLG